MDNLIKIREIDQENKFFIKKWEIDQEIKILQESEFSSWQNYTMDLNLLLMIKELLEIGNSKIFIIDG